MRRDALFHPEPKLFDKWAEGGACPYKDNSIGRLHNFTEKKELWKKGKPQMTDYELLLAIFKEKGWVWNK